MATYFISDLHLTDARPDITRGFFDWLDRIEPDADALYLLGDVFEVWLGDDDEGDTIDRVKARLAALSMPRYVMHGNRDFLIGPAFCRETGFSLLPDPSVIDVHGRRVLVMHGDSLCTRDENYMAVRAMLRDEAVQRDLLSKPLAERALIAASARSESQAHTRETATDIMDVTPSEVLRVMAAHGASLLVHGHTHRPDVHALPDGAARYVLGDWDADGWMLRCDAETMTLSHFPLA